MEILIGKHSCFGFNLHIYGQIAIEITIYVVITNAVIISIIVSVAIFIAIAVAVSIIYKRSFYKSRPCNNCYQA